ncbi:MAG: DUF460 domain-containing protein [Candidatus Micrarchaeota archaeon]
MIVGIDPGTTLGYAFLDLSGKLIHVGSARGEDKQKLIEKIRKFGKPALFATDVTPAPEFVLKVAANFNARIFEPSRDMTEREKGGISKGFAVENLHERDAVACAIKAYHNYENKFRQIDKTIKGGGMEGREDEIKSLVLEGFSVQNALLDLQAEKEIGKPNPQAKAIEPEPIDPGIIRKNEKIRELLRSNAELKKALERLESDKKSLQGKLLDFERGIYERIVRDKEIRKRDSKLRVLEKRRETTRKKQSDLKALADKNADKAGEKSESEKGESEDKKVDIDSIILRYREKSLKR